MTVTSCVPPFVFLLVAKVVLFSHRPFLYGMRAQARFLHSNQPPPSVQVQSTRTLSFLVRINKKRYHGRCGFFLRVANQRSAECTTGTCRSVLATLFRNVAVIGPVPVFRTPFKISQQTNQNRFNCRSSSRDSCLLTQATSHRCGSVSV